MSVDSTALNNGRRIWENLRATEPNQEDTDNTLKDLLPTLPFINLYSEMCTVTILCQ